MLKRPNRGLSEAVSISLSVFKAKIEFLHLFESTCGDIRFYQPLWDQWLPFRPLMGHLSSVLFFERGVKMPDNKSVASLL